MDDPKGEGGRIPLRELFEKRSDMHSALSEQHEPGADIWQPLWDWVFANDIFRSWQRNDYTWTLRCVGGPGSGKTTLSAMVAEWLRSQYTGNKDAVAAVFVREDVVAAGTAFVEDVLTSVFHQLCIRCAEVDEDEAYVAKYRLYLDARKHGHRDMFRIELIRDALLSRLSMLDRAFLVIDDFDRCSPAVDLFLENELALLARGSRLKVLITSRVSCLKTVPTWQYCDACDDEEVAMYLSVYWRCESCRKKAKPAHILCQRCRDAGRTCINCGEAADFVQPFDHVDLEIDSATQPVVRFINWDLEMEHGELGLGSENPDKPPPSALGRRLLDPRNQESLDRLRDRVSSQAKGNISLARLRLDNVHQTQSMGALFARSDVLPANIVDFFDVGIGRIEEQPPSQRDLGLKVIAAVAHYDYTLGIEYEHLQAIIRRSTKTPARARAKRTTSTPTVSTRRRRSTMPASETSHVAHRSLEEMLHAARGFLAFRNEENRPLVAFCESFHTYARENYNESLVWAHAQLDFGGEKGCAGFGNRVMRRSRTGVVHGVEKRDQAAAQRSTLQEHKGRLAGGDCRNRIDGRIGESLADSSGRIVPDTIAAGSASALQIQDDGTAAHRQTPTPSIPAMADASAGANGRKLIRVADFERDQSFKLERRGTSWA
ncbi:hypothetical protein CGRA01v4_12936 [Colletotrichum graminicola]|uniref:Nephrocystin 3-like N-terminal domain-containing protein n=1 Tax=Colletotrichum graminicola (strain M1.001 / M2 / FGSC 10212) TaxID=645133 RepID=E3QJ28_COLGM|nr:uncharacterized protein GLRG_06010 [Colletotrichum graminicola M1.001]EFQ30866.1 hypothetical protein GLRG_06010 [Colletotrichum graminicola M1.001]WDK21646.1 hypothetical protein CGRA01v4_12936 [Colletotrichum graminicola]